MRLLERTKGGGNMKALDNAWRIAAVLIVIAIWGIVVGGCSLYDWCRDCLQEL